MEVELVMEHMPEEGYIGVDDNNNDYSDLEGERCGICMDVVIDRGVLDCCQHWFCFSCIDNWATITNLCPLCQNEFQLITCVPVFDTIGSNNADEDLQSRDDDWSIEGKNNTLSFPSYYIDENAVVCLDGDGCKIRSMSASIEENSNLDTSIACDSCDIWYHAFCVGFDPEGSCEDSWLCPRCTVGLMPQKSDEVPVLRPSNQHVPETSSSQCFVDHAFSGKVMISVADAGETAIVVSMLEREKQGVEEQDPKILSNLDFCNDTKLDTGETVIIKENKRTEKPKLEAPSQISESAVYAGETADIEGNEGTEKGGIKFFARDRKLDTSSNSSVLTELNTDFVDKAMSTPNVSDGCGTSSNKLSGQLYKNEPLESGLDLHLGFSVVRPLSVDKSSSSKLAEDNKVAIHVQQKNNSHERRLSVDEPAILETKKKNVDGISGAKRKHRDWRGAEERGPKARVVSKVLAKKVNAEQSSQLVHPKEKADNSVSEDSRKSPSLVAVSKCRKLKGKSDRENVTVGIMDIVQGTEQSPLKQPAQANLEESSPLGKRENTTGLRVKKIMRRPTEDKESSMLVQKLRKEIRDAVRNKTSKEHADNLFDPKLLAAFRAAVAAGPLTETKKPPPADLRAKKSLLQKGKVRESLTKKIYGSGGKRRRAWNRDCEIEFWKYRCTQVSKPEKIETLKSVLNLLRKSPENSEIKQGYEKDAPGSSILSRLYLADSSVFPRNDDVKPLSNLKASGIPGQNKESSSTEKVNFFPSQKKIPAINSKGTKSAVPILKVEEASSSKLLSNRCSEGPSISTLGGSKSNSQNDTTVGKSYDTMTDKRKWAQQFLARKAAVTGKGAAQGQEDTAVLKGSHPLLAQLPRDMRPVLAPSRHNKIPISIRQAQLHRLTEHFLSKANMPVNRRTVEIELAVADAVNIEKGVADRSNSKLVYVNLCSQELLLRNNNRSDTSILSGSRPTEPDPEVHTDNIILEEATNDDLSSCLGVDEALRNAGLLSDSPPNSPPRHQVDEKTEEVDHFKALEEEDGPDNVFEMDAEPELDDIYGDFEYDLEDEDFIGVSCSAMTVSKRQPPGEPKLKLVLSKVDSDRSNSIWDSEEPAIVGQPDSSSNVDDKTDRCDNPQSSSFDGGEEELSLAECEELYGPDKEPVIKKFPENEQMIPDNNFALENHEGSSQTSKASEKDKGTCVKAVAPPTAGGEDEPNQSQKNVSGKGKIPKMDDIRKCPDGCHSVQKKVEAYIKEHIRPLCKSGVITVEHYRWAVGKTTEKIMKYHSKDKNASFLIKEGEKVKKLAEQYVEAAQWTAA